MTDQPSPFRDAASAIWRNRWSRVLLLIFLAFEIYNNAILPAIRGTLETEKLKAETEAATAKFLNPNQLDRCEQDGNDLDTCRRIIDRY